MHLYCCKCAQESREGIKPALFFFILFISFQEIDPALGKDYLGNFPCVMWRQLAGVLRIKFLYPVSIINKQAIINILQLNRNLLK